MRFAQEIWNEIEIGSGSNAGWLCIGVGFVWAQLQFDIGSSSDACPLLTMFVSAHFWRALQRKGSTCDSIRVFTEQSPPIPLEEVLAETRLVALGMRWEGELENHTVYGRNPFRHHLTNPEILFSLLIVMNNGFP